MEETKNTSAVILDRRPYRESDTLVTAYTRKFGKQILIARGTKKLRSKLAGHLEPISRTDIMIVRGKNFDYIGAALGQDAYAELKSDLNKLYFAGRAVAWFNRLVKENQADERLFFLLTAWLETLADFSQPSDPGKDNHFTSESGELLLSFFALKLLVELGYQPEMTKCLICHQTLKSGHNYFDLKNGGVIGAECFAQQAQRSDYQAAEQPAISDGVVKLIRYMGDNRFRQAEKMRIDKKTVKELSRLTKQMIAYVD